MIGSDPISDFLIGLGIDPAAFILSLAFSLVVVAILWLWIPVIDEVRK